MTTTPPKLEPTDMVSLDALRQAVARLKAARQEVSFTVACDPAELGADVLAVMDDVGVVMVDGQRVLVVDADHATVSHRQGVGYYCRVCGDGHHPDQLSIDGRCDRCCVEGVE